MDYQSRDLFINKDNSKDLFLKKTDINIYNIFIDLDDDTLTKEKFKYCKAVFHFNDDDKNDAKVDFEKHMEYNRKNEGRTILSYMKDMVKYLIERWNVDGFGHFCVVVEK